MLRHLTPLWLTRMSPNTETLLPPSWMQTWTCGALLSRMDLNSQLGCSLKFLVRPLAVFFASLFPLGSVSLFSDEKTGPPLLFIMGCVVECPRDQPQSHDCCDRRPR